MIIIGGNDVGALKQADIGLALLAGHANANTSENITENKLVTKVEKDGDGNIAAEDFLNAHDKKMKYRNEELNKLRAAHMKDFQARYTKEQQLVLQEEIKARTERGELFAIFTLMKDHANKVYNYNIPLFDAIYFY